MTVLIAEDDVISCRILERILQKWGYTTMIANNGLEAWNVLQTRDAPKLALLDWMMPKMSGIEVCQKIRAGETDTPVYIVLLTAKNSKEDIVEGLESGANDFITKPFNTSELRSRLRVGEKMVELQERLNKKIIELKQAAEHIQTLQGILPICMHCHKIRNDNEAWERVDMYVEKHSEAQFSHSLCPECLDKHYPECEESEK